MTRRPFLIAVHGTLVLVGYASAVAVDAGALFTNADLQGFVSLGIAALFAILAQLVRLVTEEKPVTPRGFLGSLLGAVLVAVGAVGLLAGVGGVAKPFAVGVGIVLGYRGLNLFPALEAALLARLGVPAAALPKPGDAAGTATEKKEGEKDA